MTQQTLPATTIPVGIYQIARMFHLGTPLKRYAWKQTVPAAILRLVLTFLVSCVIAIAGIALLIAIMALIAQSSSGLVLVPVGLGIALVILPFRMLIAGIKSCQDVYKKRDVYLYTCTEGLFCLKDEPKNMQVLFKIRWDEITSVQQQVEKKQTIYRFKKANGSYTTLPNMFSQSDEWGQTIINETARYRASQA